SPWRELLPYEDEAPDPDSPERRSARAHGGTAPLWVGDSDGVQARVRAERTATADADGRVVADEGVDGRAVAGGVRAAALPAGLRLELVDPGEAPAPPPGRGALRALPAHPVPPRPVPPPPVRTHPVPPRPASPQSVPTRPARTHPVPTRPVPPRSAPTHPAPTPGGAGAAPGAKPSAGSSSRKSSGKPSAGLPSGLSSGKPSPDPSSPRPSPSKATAGPLPSPAPSTQPPSALGAEVTKANAAGHTAPRPRIITRAGWGADEKIREKGHVYSKTVKVAFIHHTVTGNKYSCSQAPSVLRSIYRYHVKSLGWRDYGYNFTIDKCGKIYEGRSGGVAKAVRGAHTLGFNTNSMGVAVLGTFSTKKPPAKAVKAIAKLTAWKLGLFKRNPRGTTHLVSGGGNKYKKGASVKLHVIAGHRDGFATECPGKRLYKKLGSVRKTAARLQGR
ncbi:peptidoglycan recognition protein family protein, partial [Streptomyces hygroscopicus]